MRARNRLAVAAGAAALMALAGCTASEPQATPTPAADAVAEPEPEPSVQVVATTTVLGDITGRVVTCAGGSAETLMPIGADPHDYSPSSSAVRSLVEADLVIANGLGLEEGLESALVSAEQDGAVVMEIAPLLDPIPFGSGGHGNDEDHGHDDHGHEDDDHGHDDGHGHAHGSDDPHVWLDVARMARVAELVGSELTTITGDDVFSECGDSAAAELRSVDAEVRDILATVPDGNRVLVTDHDAFGYFAAAYDFDVIGVVVPGGSTLAEPSSAALAALAATVRDSGVRAIFANTAAPSAVVDALAGEVGEVSVVELYVGSLGPDGSGAGDYASMMRTNARLIADALTG